MLMGLGPIPNLGPMSPNSGLFPYSPAEAVPVQVPNTVDYDPASVLTPGPKFFLSFQLLLAQPLVVYHARSAWFLLLQQRTNKHEALPRSPATGPDGWFPREIRLRPSWCLFPSRELAYLPPLRMQRLPPSYCIFVHPTDQAIVLLPRGLSRLQPVFSSNNLFLSPLHATDLMQPAPTPLPAWFQLVLPQPTGHLQDSLFAAYVAHLVAASSS